MNSSKCLNKFIKIIPDSLVLQQASGWPTALFVSTLVPDGSVVADLTAGLGVNTICFSETASKVYAVEINPARCDALAENLKQAHISNVEVICSDCLNWLSMLDGNLDVAFADPARRDSSGRKMVDLEHCSPNILEVLPLLKGNCKRLIVKSSPLLDIKAVERNMPGISGFYILESEREVKELILDINLNSDSSEKPFIRIVTLTPDTQPKIFEVDSFLNHPVCYLADKKRISPGGYVYEPSPAFMKAGAFAWLSKNYEGVLKFAPNTHLFYSEHLHKDFPGRIFRVEGFVGSSDLKKMKGADMNVISRNHPAKAPELEARYRFNPFGRRYIIACSVNKYNFILLVEKL